MPAKNKKTKRSLSEILKLIIFGTNIIAMLMLVLSVLAWNISPKVHIIFSYLGLFFPFILAINCIYLILWITSFNWKLAAISFCVLAACWKPISTYFPFHFKDKEVPEDCIKLLSYNVRAFNGYKKEADGTPNNIFQYIRDSKADIVCLQEYVAMRKTGGHTASEKEISKYLKQYPYHAIVDLAASNRYSHYGLACYSKYPIVKTIKIPTLGYYYNGSAIFRIKIKDKTISIVNNHLESNKITSEDKQLYQRFIDSKNSDMIESIAHNIKNRMGIAYRKRAVQVDTVATYIQQEKDKTDAMIVCGDFNDTPISYAYHKLRGDLNDSFAETGRGVGITYHENHFWFRIDYILHDNHFKAYNTEVGKISYSDHYPVMTYLEWNQKEGKE